MRRGTVLRGWKRTVVTAIAAALSIALLPGSGARANDPSAPVAIGPPWSVVGVGDFNGDSAADILWHNSATNETQIWFMSGWDIEWRYPVENEGGAPAIVGLPWSIAGVGDMNDDGKADIVWHNSDTNETKIWYMNGGYKIDHQVTVEDEGGTPILIGPPWSIVGAGTSEIFWHNSVTNETQIWHLNHFPSANPRITQRVTVKDEGGTPILIGPPWSISAISDEYHDDSSDIVWHNSVTGETQIWILNYNGTIYRRPTIVDESGFRKLVDEPWSIVGAGDIDGHSYHDGQYLGSDILWYNSATGELRLWILNNAQSGIAVRSDIYNDPYGPPPPPPAPAPFKSFQILNCYGTINATKDTTMSISIWFRDVTEEPDGWLPFPAPDGDFHYQQSTNWVAGYKDIKGNLIPSSCPGPDFVDNGSGGLSPAHDGHVYEFKVVDDTAPGCDDSPDDPNQCILADFQRVGGYNNPSGVNETHILTSSP